MARRRRRLASRLRGSLRSLVAFLFSNVGVIVLVMGYTVAGMFWETSVWSRLSPSVCHHIIDIIYGVFVSTGTGAFIFQSIEGAGELERIGLMTRERRATAEWLWSNVTLTLNLFNETELKYRIGKELMVYQRKVVRAVRRGWDGGRAPRQWTFSSAFLYSMTVITTIGYGNLSPRTTWGKLATIFYALLGMPLFLLYLSNVGQLLARWFKCLYACACLCRGCPGLSRRRVARLRTQIELSEVESIERPEGWGKADFGDLEGFPHYNHYRQDFRRPPLDRYADFHEPRRPDRLRTRSLRPVSNNQDLYTHDLRRGYSEPVRRGDVSSISSSEFTYVTFDAQTITVPISVCVAIMVGYIIFGSMIFGMWEKWDHLDGAYFCFVSLSSIGFGDFVPGERVYSQKIDTSFIVCSLYLTLGMALVAMCFNLMQEQVIHYVAGLKRALRRICRCKR